MTEIRWTCPSCSSLNLDDYLLTSIPICGVCDTEFDWDEILQDGQEVPCRGCDGTGYQPYNEAEYCMDCGGEGVMNW